MCRSEGKPKYEGQGNYKNCNNRTDFQVIMDAFVQYVVCVLTL